MKIIYAFLLSFFAWPICAQQIHTITEYSKPLEGKDTTTKVTHLWEYTKTGLLVRNADFEYKNSLLNKYNDKGQIIISERQSSDSFIRCQYAYSAKSRKCLCANPGNTFTTLETDSIDQAGRITYTLHREKITNEKKEVTQTSRTHIYEYNNLGKETLRKDIDPEKGVYYWQKSLYYKNGSLSCFMTCMGDENTPLTDSTVYFYDEKGRVVSLKKYVPKSGKTRLDLYAAVDLKYVKSGEAMPVADNEKLNDTLIYEYLVKPFHEVAFKPGPMLSNIKIRVFNKDDLSHKIDLEYGCFYDDKGRIILIGGGGKHYESENQTTNLEVRYDGNMAVVNNYGENYMKSRVSGKTSYYEGYLLKKWTYNTEHGFPFREVTYKYTFFER